MENWLRDRLSSCLNFQIPNDMIRYIMSMKTPEEYNEYFKSLLNNDCEEHCQFLVECRQRLFKSVLANKKTSNNKSRSRESSVIVQNVIKSPDDAKILANNTQGAKKKTKYINLYTTDGSFMSDTILLKGRRICHCETSQHKLINNCLKCGRIVCEQEGTGPCLFCGELVCTNAEQQELKMAIGKKRDQLLKAMKEKGSGEALKKAFEQRDRLLEYDRNSEKRTTVIDDEFDYFDENSVWHTAEQREELKHLKNELHEKKYISRTQRKITFDFAGREIDSINADIENYHDKVMKKIASINCPSDSTRNTSSVSYTQNSSNDVYFSDPKNEGPRPLYSLSNDEVIDKTNPRLIHDLERSYNRVQDKELMEMQDMRKCLSLHQPWASLLVTGIKKHEGRVWYTSHRGRLWIAATAREAKPDDIEEIEKFYKQFYNDPKLKFPDNYPTGCLLGCVKIDECLAQEEYSEIYPNGESESPYVFICSEPEQLPVMLPIKGHQKIYEIEPMIHNTACKALLQAKLKRN